MIINKDVAIEDGDINAQDRQRWEKGFHCCSCTYGYRVRKEWKCNHGPDIRKNCLSYFHPPLHREKFEDITAEDMKIEFLIPEDMTI